MAVLPDSRKDRIYHTDTPSKERDLSDNQRAEAMIAVLREYPLQLPPPAPGKKIADPTAFLRSTDLNLDELARQTGNKKAPPDVARLIYDLKKDNVNLSTYTKALETIALWNDKDPEAEIKRLYAAGRTSVKFERIGVREISWRTLEEFYVLVPWDEKKLIFRHENPFCPEPVKYWGDGYQEHLHMKSSDHKKTGAVIKDTETQTKMPVYDAIQPLETPWIFILQTGIERVTKYLKQKKK